MTSPIYFIMEAQTHKGNGQSYYEHNFTEYLWYSYVLMEIFSTLWVARQKSSLTHTSNTGFHFIYEQPTPKRGYFGIKIPWRFPFLKFARVSQ